MLHILASTHIFVTQHLITNLFLHNTPNVLNGIHVGKFPGHSRRDVPLHSRNVLVLIELWRGARLCIKIYHFFGNTTYSHESVFRSHNNRRYCRVWRKQKEKHHAKCIQTTVKSPVGVQVWGAGSRREKLWEKWMVTWIIRNTREILYVILKWHCAVFQQKGSISVWMSRAMP